MIYVIDILLRLYTYRRLFFRSPGSIFDLTVVSLSVALIVGQILRALAAVSGSSSQVWAKG